MKVTMEQMLYDIETFIKHLNGKKVHIINFCQLKRLVNRKIE